MPFGPEYPPYPPTITKKENTMSKKKVQIEIATVYAYCPECGGCLLSHHGSYLINIFDSIGDEKYMCEKCGKKWAINT